MHRCSLSVGKSPRSSYRSPLPAEAGYSSGLPRCRWANRGRARPRRARLRPQANARGYAETGPTTRPPVYHDTTRGQRGRGGIRAPGGRECPISSHTLKVSGFAFQVSGGKPGLDRACRFPAFALPAFALRVYGGRAGLPPSPGTAAGVPTHRDRSGRRPNPTRPVVHPSLVGLAFQAGRLQPTPCGFPAFALRVYGGRAGLPPSPGTAAGVATHSAWSGRRPNPTRPVVYPTLVGLAFQAGRLQPTACGFPAFARDCGGRGAEACACRIWLPESARVLSKVL